MWSYDVCAPVEYYFNNSPRIKLCTLAITYHHNFDAIDDISGNCDMVDYIGEEEYFNEILERVTLFNV